MIKRTHLSLTLAICALVAAAPACKKDAEGNADAAAAAGSASAAPEPKAAEKPVTLDEFLAQVAPATCKTVTECKNDKFKVVATMPVMLIVGFGTIDKPELAKEAKSVDTSMKADKRWIPNASECTTMGNVAMKVMGIQSETVTPKVGKTVTYDAAKAKTCLDALAKAPDACGQEEKLTSEPKMKDIEAFSKDLKPAIDAFAAPCEEVLTGTVEEGGACELDVECKGKKAKCKAAAGGKAKSKKDKGQEAKTCQAKG